MGLEKFDKPTNWKGKKQKTKHTHWGHNKNTCDGAARISGRHGNKRIISLLSRDGHNI